LELWRTPVSLTKKYRHVAWTDWKKRHVKAGAYGGREQHIRHGHLGRNQSL
jgi:hypothetical protein